MFVNGNSKLIRQFKRSQLSVVSHESSVASSGLWSLPSALFLGDRLTVGRLALNQAMEVRFLLPELGDKHSGVAAAGSGAWL